MNRLTRIITIAALLAICHLQGTAQSLVTPPAGLPQEKWELTYDDYRALIYDHIDLTGILGHNQDPDYPIIPTRDVLVKLKREVLLVRNGNDVYIKGIFQVYPKAWIKCRVDGDKVIVSNNQAIDMNGPIYFHWGSAYHDTYAVREYKDSYKNVDFTNFTSGDNLILFTISDNGDTITARTAHTDWLVPAEEFLKPSFWFDGDVKGDWVFGCDWGGYPDVGYMVNMVFRKIKDSGN